MDRSMNQCLDLKKGGDGAVFGIPINQCVELSRKKSTTDIPPDEANQLIKYQFNNQSYFIEIKSILIINNYYLAVNESISLFKKKINYKSINQSL